MNNQTALQELIEWIDLNDDQYGIITIDDLKSKATELLEKEKNIIVDAWQQGQNDCGEFDKPQFVDGISYYHQTYIQ